MEKKSLSVLYIILVLFFAATPKIATAAAPYNTVTTVAVSPASPGVYGSTVVFTAHVRKASDNSCTAAIQADTVAFKEGSVVLQAAASLNTLCDITFVTSALSVGTHVITADFSGNSGGSDKANPSSGSNSFTVTPAAQTITVSSHAPASAVYGSVFSVSAWASSGLDVSITADGGCSGGGSNSATITMTSGTTACNVYYNQGGNGNYNAAAQVIDVAGATKADQTIIFPAIGSKTYGDGDFEITPSATSGLGLNILASGNCSSSETTVHVAAAGSCTVIVSQSGNDNYNAAEDASQTFGISPKTITVTANALSKTYGEADPVLTYGVTGELVGSDAFTGAIERAVGEDVGEYAVSQGDLSLGGNYNLVFVANKFVISPKAILTVTADGKTITYGDADPQFSFIYDGFKNSDTLSDVDLQPTCSVAGEHTNVGTYAIVCSGASDNNYDFSYIAGSLIINKKPVSVAAAALSKTYGEADPVLVYTNDNLVGTDAFAGVLARDAGEKVGIYPINIGTLSLSDNYSLNYTGADFTIIARPISVTAASDSKTYDGTTSSSKNPTITFGTLAGTDTAEWSQTFDTAEVGTGKNIIPSGSVSDGNEGKNYLITFVNNTAGVIAAQTTGGGGGGGSGWSGSTVQSVEQLAISDIRQDSSETNSFTVVWSTNFAASSYVIYSSENESHNLNMFDVQNNPPLYGYAHATPEIDTNPKTLSHTITITGLAPNTKYYYRTVSRGSLAISEEFSATTPAVAGAQTETLSQDQPIENAVVLRPAQIQKASQVLNVANTPEENIKNENPVPTVQENNDSKTGEESKSGGLSSTVAAAGLLPIATKYFWPLLIVFLVVCVAYIIYTFIKRRKKAS